MTRGRQRDRSLPGIMSVPRQEEGCRVKVTRGLYLAEVVRTYADVNFAKEGGVVWARIVESI